MLYARSLYAYPAVSRTFSGALRLHGHVRKALMSSGAVSYPSSDLRDHIQNHDLVNDTCFIGGKWQPRSDDVYKVWNPASGQEVSTVQHNGAVEATAAVEAARTAFEQWKDTTAAERASILLRWKQLMAENTSDIQKIMVLEAGKPLQEALGEINAGLTSVAWFAGEAKRMNGVVLPPTAPNRRHMTIMQPVGVVAAITPWNFPFSMITRKVAPALAAGCCIVLKPSEETPHTAFAIAALAHEAGLPPGVLNVVSGDAPAIGEVLSKHPDVRKLTFTGSTRVGKLLLRQAADTVKRCSMELGGNAPYIVFEDADVEKAAAAAVASGLRNAGQTCISANRMLVAEGVQDQLREALKKRLEAVQVGNGMDPSTHMGPCINSARISLAQQHVDDAVARGAAVVCGGGPPAGLERGHFFRPTLLANANVDMRIFREETFAPVIPLFPFKTEEEAVRMANDTDYGLAAYFFTNDLNRAFRVAEKLEYGMVGVNEVAVVSETAPFGGVKQSGLGREHGRNGILEFLEEKHVCIGLS